MSEDYSFEDKMKSLFEEEREHPYDPDQWHRLARRLKEHDRPPMIWWQRWMPYGFILLLGLLGWQLLQQQKLQQTVASLSRQLATVEEKNLDPPLYQGQTLVIYDTIYRQTVTDMTSAKSSVEAAGIVSSKNYWSSPGFLKMNYPLFFKDQQFPEKEKNLLISGYSATARQGLQPYPSFGLREFVDAADQPGPEPGDPYYITDLLMATAVQQLPTKEIAFPAIFAPAAAPPAPPRGAFWQHIKPQGYTFSIGGGRFKSWAYFTNDDGDLFGDLNVEALFQDRLSLELGAVYLQRVFERYEPENTPDDLPVAPPLDRDDELENIRGELQQLQFPIGLRYYAWQSGRFQLYLGAGVVPSLALSSSSISYEYENDEDEYYTVSASDVLPAGLRLGGVYGRLGLQANLGKRWQLEAGVTGIQPLGDYAYPYQRPSWGRWRLGLGYRLK